MSTVGRHRMIRPSRRARLADWYYWHDDWTAFIVLGVVVVLAGVAFLMAVTW